MEQNAFSFGDKFCRQTFGTSMGNSLSPFIANAFLNWLENSLKKSVDFPSVWHPYVDVDDVFAIHSKQGVWCRTVFNNYK